jgi:universal stress protein E
MLSARKILVGVDLASEKELVADALSLSTREAVERALWFGKAVGAEVTFLSALKIPQLSTEDIVEHSAASEIFQHGEEVLARLVSQAEEAGLTAHSRLIAGRPWQELIREVLRHQHDLLVVGSHEAGPARRLLFGSTALKLLRKCPCPLWVVRPAAEKPTPTILVADDLTDVGREALEAGVLLAQLMNARLLIVHATEFPLDRRLFRTGLAEEELEAYRKRVRTQAEQAIQQRLHATDFRTITAGVQVKIESGPAAIVIEEAIAEHEVDLLVMGTLARGGIAGILLGNTAEEVLPRVTCSALTFKPADFVCPVALET